MEWTDKHPSFQGLRQDKCPKEVVREVVDVVINESQTVAKKMSAVRGNGVSNY